MYTIDIQQKTLTFTTQQTSSVILREGVNTFYTSSGTTFSIPLPLKNNEVKEGTYVLTINGVEVYLPYAYPKESPSVKWDVNGLLSVLSVYDDKAYTGTIVSQSITVIPPLPLQPKTDLVKVEYPANIVSGEWAVNRKVKISYDGGNGLEIVNNIDYTESLTVPWINAENVFNSAATYVQEFINKCSPAYELPKFTKINAYLQQYDSYVKLCDTENAYECLVKAGELLGVDTDIHEIIPFTIDCGCCAGDLVPVHTAYYGFSDKDTLTEQDVKSLSVDRFNTRVHREWLMKQDGITPRYAYIVLPVFAAALVAMVKIKGGLFAHWDQYDVTVNGVKYKAIKSPNKFYDKEATFITDSLSDCEVVSEWVTQNGNKVTDHIEDKTIHVTPEEKAKLAYFEDQIYYGGTTPTGSQFVWIVDSQSSKQLSTIINKIFYGDQTPEDKYLIWIHAL